MSSQGHDSDGEEQPWTAERLSQSSYKDLGSPAEVEKRFYHHLMSLESCRSSLYILLTANSNTTRDFSLEIDAFDLLESDPVLGHLLLRFPSTMLPLLENSIVMAQESLKDELKEHFNGQLMETHQSRIGESQHSNSDDKTPVLVVKGDSNSKTRVHARLVHLPPTCCRASVASMEAKDVGKIVQLSGTVVRTSPVQMYESARTYKCTGKEGCGQTFMQYADMEQRTNALAKPDRCPLLIQGGQRCKGTNLVLQKDGSVHTDYQEIKIQEAGTPKPSCYFLFFGFARLLTYCLYV